LYLACYWTIKSKAILKPCQKSIFPSRVWKDIIVVTPSLLLLLWYVVIAAVIAFTYDFLLLFNTRKRFISYGRRNKKGLKTAKSTLKSFLLGHSPSMGIKV